MWKPIRHLLSGLLASTLLWAQAPSANKPAAAPQKPWAPVLEPGEGLAVGTPDGRVSTYGEARAQAPMGSLAKLVWVRLEGNDWMSQGILFKCTGQMGPWTCWKHDGHGKVDLGKALEDSCNLAFLAWMQEARGRWARLLGPDVGRYRLEETFKPFLGNRFPTEDGLPPLGPEWIGDGDLLRTSPEAFLRWLLDPNQEELLSRLRNLLLSYLKGFEPGVWWMKTGTAPVPGDPGATSAWVAGSNGSVTAVLHLPRGRGKAEGLARFRAVLGIPDKPAKR